jgi:hypothetical protein
MSVHAQETAVSMQFLLAPVSGWRHPEFLAINAAHMWYKYRIMQYTLLEQTLL